MLGGEFIEETTFYNGKKNEYFERKPSIETSYHEKGILSHKLDTYIDNEADGTLDRRIYEKGNYGEPEIYEDKNLDGTFETKSVYDKDTKRYINYYRDDNGNWVKK